MTVTQPTPLLPLASSIPRTSPNLDATALFNSANVYDASPLATVEYRSLEDEKHHVSTRIQRAR